MGGQDADSASGLNAHVDHWGANILSQMSLHQPAVCAQAPGIPSPRLEAVTVTKLYSRCQVLLEACCQGSKDALSDTGFILTCRTTL